MQILNSKFIFNTKLFYLLYFIILQACTSSTDKIPAPEKDFCASIHRNDTISLSKELKEHHANMQTKTGVYVLEDGDAAMMSRAWLCEYAEKSIDIQYFIFSTDNVGLIACDYLVRAADRGVHVRILVDDIMVEASGKEILTMDSHKNIDIKIYNPGVNLGKNLFQKTIQFATHFKSANQRMHNKTFIVDGKVAITGGRNIADEYFDYDHAYNFRDRDVLLLGKVNKTITQSFNTFWHSSLSIPVSKLVSDKIENFSDTISFERLHQYACNPNNFWPQVRARIQHLPDAFKLIQKNGTLHWVDSVYFISDMPGKNDGSKGLHGGGICTDTLMQLVKQATSTIDIQSPYLITTSYGQQLFSEAIRRGVKIRILTNSLASTDNLEAFSAYQKSRKQLLQSGIRIFEFRPDAQERYKIMTGSLQAKLNYTPIFGLHAKSMVIDGKITVIGTFNLDPRSANLNTECIAVIYDKPTARSVLSGMETEFKPDNSWETTATFNPDSKAGKYKQMKSNLRKVIPKSIL
ncbi:MAG: phospholipase D family protein [Bacteroidetes bacterium]|nr:phospholipase D family protein [Bacteroidota bacterium]